MIVIGSADVSGHLRLIDGQHFPILQTFKLKEGPFINYQVHPMVSREPKQWCINQFNRGDQGGDFYWRYLGMTVSRGTVRSPTMATRLIFDVVFHVLFSLFVICSCFVDDKEEKKGSRRRVLLMISESVEKYKTKVKEYSTDHKLDLLDELDRIQEAGGRVIYWDGRRVLGVLATSRAIGDNYLKPYVSSEPEVTVTERIEEDEFMILASDGLWDVVTNDAACATVQMYLNKKGGRGGGRRREATECEERKEEKAPAADDDDDMDPFGDETEEEKKAAEEKKGGKDTKKPKGRKMKSAAYLTRRLMKAETDVQPEALKVVNLEDLYGTLATTLVNFEDL
ncbi:hypothetical protein IGI04_016219 [Brassica rapa subsp. trilocularis]|nr:hypothetical protein IGI04_016219 [Brassica rapa subsp. trilocularis]